MHEIVICADVHEGIGGESLVMTIPAQIGLEQFGSGENIKWNSQDFSASSAAPEILSFRISLMEENASGK
jgi:hypothetical protein